MDDPNALYLGFSLPPGTGKTTLIKFLLAYIIGKNPKAANMYVSYSDGMTKMLLDSERSMLTDTNEYCFHDIFPGLGMPDISAEYKTLSYRRAGDFPTLGLISLGGSVTGRTRANSYLITDDLVKNKEEARSPERLEKLYSDYTATLTTRMIGDNVKQIMLGTRWSAYDPIGRMESEHGDDPRYSFISIPVWDENEVSNFEYEHPDRYTTEKIRDIKETIDSADFECLFMQHGVEKEGLAFASDKLKYYNGVLPDGEPDNIVFANDVAWGGGDSLSMPIAYIYGGDVYIHDWIFDKRDKSCTKPRVVAKILNHKVKMGQTEANNGGEEYSDDVHRILKQEYGYSINMSHKKAPTNMAKLTRIEQHAPTIRNFYFRDSKCRDDDYRRAMAELTSFSFTAKNLHDDAPDSLAMLTAFISERPRIVTVAKRPF
jgi:predicted phage terminase large subunit-like protein